MFLMEFKISEIFKIRLLVLILIVFCFVLFDSCKDDITGIKQAELDFTPMWPQVGYDGRHSSNSFGIKAYIQPVSQGIVDWVDTLGENNEQSNIINCVDSKGNIYILGAHLNGPLYKFRNDGSLIWKKDSVSGGYINGVSLSRDETKLYFSGVNELCCYDSSGFESWVYSGNVNSVTPVVGKSSNIYCSIDNRLTAVNGNGLLEWQGGIAGAFSYFTLDRDENIYSASGGIEKYDVKGSLKWTHGGGCISPVLIDGYNNLYFISPHNYSYNLTSIDKNGVFRWTKEGITYWSTHAIGKNNTIYTTSGEYIYALDTGGTELWRSLIIPSSPEHIEPYLVLDSEDNIYYMTQIGMYSTAASMDKNGNFRWFVNTVIDPIHGGPVISPAGKLIFQPKYMDVLVCVK